MRKILIASSREPNGATWLINCFLALDVKCFRNVQDQMWKVQPDGSYVLSEDEKLLKKWLPALHYKKEFHFKKDLVLEWVHEWPQNKYLGQDIIHFVRDPRDALFSRYKRERPNLTYAEFIEFPDNNSLLNKADNWFLFNYLWSKVPDTLVVRFEDYKVNPKQLLISILNHLQLSFTDDEIEVALDMSTSDKASKVEMMYESMSSSGGQIVNQGGIVGRWQMDQEAIDVSNFIELRCGSLMQYFNYKINMVPIDEQLIKNEVQLITDQLPQFAKLVNYKKAPSSNISEELSNKLKVIISSLDHQKLTASKLESYEIDQLIFNLNHIHVSLYSSANFKLFKLGSNACRKKMYLDYGQFSTFLLLSLRSKVSIIKIFILNILNLESIKKKYII